MRAAATLGTRAVAGARGHARMRKSEPVNVTKKSRGSDSMLRRGACKACVAALERACACDGGVLVGLQESGL